MAIRLILILLLMACSSNRDFDKMNDLIDNFINYEEKDILPITKNIIEYIQYPLIEVQTNGVLKQALFIPLSSRNNFYNYTSGSGQNITLNGAAVSKTNGINIGLISLETEEDSPLLRLTNPKEWDNHGFSKTYVFINPLNNRDVYKFKCFFEIKDKEKINISGNDRYLYKILEKCKNQNREFENFYLVDKIGIVWKSRQWISPNNIIANITVHKK